MDAAIVTVGDELLGGDTENTNATWLCRELSERGVTVRRVLTVPDVTEDIASNVRTYAEAYDAVVVTGGLGGTPDDVTMAGVAAAFGRSMDPSDRARADLERSLAAIAEDRPGLDLEVDLEAEASIPSGSRPLINGAGLSPGCVVEATEEHGAVYVLPGIPGEMTAMFGDVAGEFAGAVRSATLYTEEPEANLNGRLDEVRERFGVQVGCYPDREAGHNRLKIRGEASDALAGAEAWLSENVETVEYTMGE